MTTKRHINKRNIRQSKIINSVAKPVRMNEQSEASERAIIRQFHLIQKKSSSLLSDVMKELDLVKNWLEKQATSKRNELRARLNKG